MCLPSYEIPLFTTPVTNNYFELTASRRTPAGEAPESQIGMRPRDEGRANARSLTYVYTNKTWAANPGRRRSCVLLIKLAQLQRALE